MLRAAASAVITSSLVLSAAGPALAAEADTTAPVIVSTGLTEGQLVSGVHTFYPEITDDVGVTGVEVWVNGVYAGGSGVKDGKRFVQAYLNKLPDGSEAEISIRARDAVPNLSDRVTTRVRVDLVKPTATVKPDGEFILTGRHLTVTATDVSEDAAAVVMYDRNDNELARATAAPWTLPLDTADLGDFNSVRVTVVDRAGNETHYYRFFDIDLTGPTGSVESMVPGYVGPGVQILIAEAEDRAGVDRAEWWIDGALRGTFLPQLNYDFGKTDRSTTVELRTWDKFGNPGVTRYPVKVDVQGPTLVSQSPVANARVRGHEVKATLKLADPSGVSWIMQEGGYDLKVSEPWTTTFRLGADGRQNLAWLVYDVWGNQRKISQTVVVDNTGPSASWLSPASNALVRGTKISSSVKASDGAGIKSATLSGAAADTTAPYASSIAAGKDGKKTLTWTVIDKLGNSTVVRRTVTVDNTKASLKVTKAPANKAKVKGTVKVTASASDKNGVARVELLVNGKVVAVDKKAAYKFSVDTRKHGKKIKIQLRAYDRAGNVTKTSTRTWIRR
jgi:hypothetical protein